MRRALAGVAIGATIQAKVTEVLDGTDLIFSLDGDLMRVHNESRRALKPGDVVTLVVQALNPIRFRLQDDLREQRRRGHLDVSV